MSRPPAVPAARYARLPAIVLVDRKPSLLERADDDAGVVVANARQRAAVRVEQPRVETRQRRGEGVKAGGRETRRLEQIVDAMHPAVQSPLPLVEHTKNGATQVRHCRKMRYLRTEHELYRFAQCACHIPGGCNKYLRHWPFGR